MPVQTSYPGVYIQELPAGTHTITGVATSITAFVGRAARGPLDTAVTITSLSDYNREFGGLDPDSPMSFAVADFFANGGSTAVIVRLYTASSSGPPPTAIINVYNGASPIGTLFQLIAASPGSWGQYLTVSLDNSVLASTAAAMGVSVANLCNLTVTDTSTNTVEVHRNVTLVNSSRRIDQVLLAESDLVRWPPAAATLPLVTIGEADPTTFSLPNPWNLPAPPSVTSAVVAPYPSSGAELDGATFLPAQATKKGLYSLEQVDLFNILVVPPAVGTDVTDGNQSSTFVAPAAKYCADRRAILLLDLDADLNKISDIQAAFASQIGPLGTNAANCATFFPRIEYANPFHDSRIEAFVPSGAIAGVMAATDSARGVWKAPAGLDAMLSGVTQLAYDLTDLENGQLNPLGLNCIRNKPGVPSPVVWGSRTAEGDDRMQSQWKYLPVRRMALFLEESLYQGTQWVVFEPNDEPLWAAIRTSVTAFMQGLFLQEAFQGQTPDDAYFVKCDDETTTQSDIDNGIVNIVVGFAPLKPAEFVVLSLQQMTGQTGM
jgi:hypothetical protein